ncbi:MAG TPA: DUF3131 domain-containing protein [Candidatus Binatia bacterium]|nr:DUF3131 domain-containing protein [Candidatus Binatia bacterium]
MTFKEGLIAARSQIIFLLGLVAAFAIIIALERNRKEDTPSRAAINVRYEALALRPREQIPQPLPEPLTAEEQIWAAIAWRYFVNNLQPSTGLVNSVDNYPASTMWDTASYLLALISAHRLEIIRREEFDHRLTQALTSLARLPLFEDQLPNKSYNTTSLRMVDYTNKPVDRGIGWSAIDIGRLLVPFNIIVWNYPSHVDEVKAILSRWRFDNLLRGGVIYGAAVDAQGVTIYVQEGRLGYEEYAAKSLTLLGLDVFTALRYDDFLIFVEIDGVPIPTDSRAPESYIVSEPYVLDGIEFGWDEVSRDFAYRVYEAQYNRFRRTGTPTAVSEDNIDRPPYFVYNTVFTGGKAWNCISAQGEDASASRSLSTKAVFGWYALYRTSYTRDLLDKVRTLFDAARGWYSGLYEQDGRPNKAITGNTNAIILEALAYKRFGKLVGFQAPASRERAVATAASTGVSQ